MYVEASALIRQDRFVTAYMSTQREVLEGQTGSHRAKRANFGRGVRGAIYVIPELYL